MRIYSYLFHFVLALAALALGLVALLSGTPNLKLPLLPFEGPALTLWLIGLALAGLIVVALAVKGIARILFLVWSLFVAGLLLKSYIFSSYKFSSPDSFYTLLYVLAGALLACVGAWFAFRSQPVRR